MKVLFIARSTLYEVYGGDTVQMLATAKYLRQNGVDVDIKLTHEKIDYSPYDLLHLFNIIRPADHLYHVKKSRKPFVISTIYVDFKEYERRQRKGISKWATRIFPPGRIEYFKVIARLLKNGERIRSPEYLWKGHKNSIRYLAKKAEVILPNSFSEALRFAKDYKVTVPFHVIFNGIDPEIFPPQSEEVKRDPKLVLCVARIEGKKNQLKLIEALNDTPFQLLIIGKPAPNHLKYYEDCRRIAASNVSFEGFVPIEKLQHYYRKAKVHVLPSWNETCGLSSLEAAYNGCNIVVTDKGDTKEYYHDHAWYCDPDDADSILQAVITAAEAPTRSDYIKEIDENFTWKNAASETLNAYQDVLHSNKLIDDAK